MSKAAVSIGFLTVVAGVALIYYPAALILAGGLLMLFGLFYDDDGMSS